MLTMHRMLTGPNTKSSTTGPSAAILLVLRSFPDTALPEKEREREMAKITCLKKKSSCRDDNITTDAL